jgi:ketosteroid isomerase-like protein
MTEQQMKDASNGFEQAWMEGDTKQALSFFAEDAVWIAPNGTFKGKAQIEKYLIWVNKVVKNYRITETGIGIVVQGDVVIAEHILSGTIDGMKFESPAVCIDEFKNGKIVNLRTYFDRLAQSQQVAKGVFAKFGVNAVVNGVQKGLS